MIKRVKKVYIYLQVPGSLTAGSWMKCVSWNWSSVVLRSHQISRIKLKAGFGDEICQITNQSLSIGTEPNITVLERLRR